MSETPNRLMSLWADIKSYVELNVEYARLTVAEKATVLLTALVTAAIIGALALIVLFFMSIAAVHWLAMTMSLALAYSIMTGFNVILLVLVYLFRRQIIITPIAKFITKLILR